MEANDNGWYHEKHKNLPLAAEDHDKAIDGLQAVITEVSPDSFPSSSPPLTPLPQWSPLVKAIALRVLMDDARTLFAKAAGFKSYNDAKKDVDWKTKLEEAAVRVLGWDKEDAASRVALVCTSNPMRKMGNYSTHGMGRKFVEDSVEGINDGAVRREMEKIMEAVFSNIG